MEKYYPLRTAIHALIFLSLFISLFFHPQSALACSCVPPEMPNIEYKEHVAVFSGKVVYISYVESFLADLVYITMYSAGFNTNNYGRSPFYDLRVILEVTKSWKGIDASSVLIRTGRGGGDCGYDFDIGKDYLVYVNRSYGKPDGYLITSICSRNAELSAATVDLAYLNTLPTIPLKSPLAKIISISFFIFISLLASIIYIWKRRKNLTKDV